MEPTEIDVALREAIYFEALKENEAEEATSYTDDVMAALIALLLKRGYTSFVDIRKTEFSGFLIEAKKALVAVLDKSEVALVERLQTVLAVVLDVHKRTSEAVSKRKIVNVDLSGAKAANKRLWDRITKDTIPGAGVSFLEMMKQFKGAVVTQLLQAAKRAYADKWKVDDFITFLKGTKKRNFKDGALNKIGNQLKTVVRTAMAQLRTRVAYEIGNILYSRYQWISTIDSATTDICRSRHLKIYEYGRGPVPPAHLNCRSIIVGTNGDLSNQIPRTYWDWIRQQPAAFLNDVLLPAQVNSIRNGSARAPDFPVFRNVRRVTPAQFGRATNNILGE